jgi:hypothetical protein
MYFSTVRHPSPWKVMVQRKIKCLKMFDLHESLICVVGTRFVLYILIELEHDLFHAML